MLTEGLKVVCVAGLLVQKEFLRLLWGKMTIGRTKLIHRHSIISK